MKYPTHCPKCHKPYVFITSMAKRNIIRAHDGNCCKCEDCGEYGWHYGIYHWGCKKHTNPQEIEARKKMEQEQK